MNALKRREDCERLIADRAKRGADLGPQLGWAYVLGNMLRVLNETVDAAAIQKEARRIGVSHWFGLDGLDRRIVAGVVQEITGKAWGKYRLYSTDVAGAYVELTVEERDRAGITNMAATAEPQADRDRRRDRERKAEKRAAEAALAPPKMTKKAIADALRVSRPTLDKMIREGRVDAETGEVIDFTNLVPVPCTYGTSNRTENVKVRAGEIDECEISRRRSISPSEKSEHTKILTGTA